MDKTFAALQSVTDTNPQQLSLIATFKHYSLVLHLGMYIVYEPTFFLSKILLKVPKSGQNACFLHY